MFSSAGVSGLLLVSSEQRDSHRPTTLMYERLSYGHYSIYSVNVSVKLTLEVIYSECNKNLNLYQNVIINILCKQQMTLLHIVSLKNNRKANYSLSTVIHVTDIFLHKYKYVFSMFSPQPPRFIKK